MDQTCEQRQNYRENGNTNDINSLHQEQTADISGAHSK